jgi:hypothetical protein
LAHGFWGLDEELGSSELPLSSFQTSSAHNNVDALLWISVPMREGLWREDSKSLIIIKIKIKKNKEKERKKKSRSVLCFVSLLNKFFFKGEQTS